RGQSSFWEEQTTIGCAVTLPFGPLSFFLSPFHFTLPFIVFCVEGVLFVCSKPSWVLGPNQWLLLINEKSC
ncbi:hypothetical protein BHE74_00048029, partial [Ensete ventricosum]